MQELLTKAWWLDHLCFRPNKVVAKLFDEDGFRAAVNIPTVLWPLSGEPEVFHWNNCLKIEDETVKRIVDGIPYHIGHCYQNSEAVCDGLLAAGYRAKFYAGWMFISGSTYPLHHAWVVLETDAGKSVIDLADDISLMDFNHEQFEAAEDAREAMLSFQKWAMQYPHSQRCMPFGVPAARLLYVGSEDNRLSAINTYNSLIQKYPNHPCRRPHDESGRTKMQQMMVEAGMN